MHNKRADRQYLSALKNLLYKFLDGVLESFNFIEALNNPQDGYISFKYVINDQILASKTLTIRPFLNQDMAKLSLEADGIYASIQSSKLKFTADGLEIRNGGIDIVKDKYEEVSLTNDTYAPNDYYILTSEGYVLCSEKEYNSNYTYYRLTFEKQLDFNEITGNLEITGTIYATDGSFTGSIYAEDGKINGQLIIGDEAGSYILLNGTNFPIYKKIDLLEENFEPEKYYEYDEANNIYILSDDKSYNEETQYYEKQIYNEGIYSNNYLQDNKKGFYIGVDGSIIANNIILGSSAQIAEKLQIGDNCFIYNPNYADGKFIDILDNNKKSLFSLNNMGVITLESSLSTDDNKKGISLNPNSTSISSLNFISGISGWHIDPNIAEFNNIAARGSLYASVFAYGEIQTIGGSVLVRPAAKIKNATEDGEYINIELETPTAGFEPGSYCSIKDKEILYQIVEDETQTLAEDEKSEEFIPVAFKIKKIPKSEGTQYLDTIDMIGKTIISFGIEDSFSYIKVTKPTENEFVFNKYYQYNTDTDEHTLITEYNPEIDYYIRKINLKENISIAINASDSPANYAPNAISVFSTDFDENNSTEDNFKFIDSAKIILGKMDGEDSYGGLTGYGLYADNVYLKGSLIAEGENKEFYSGINTKSNITWRDDHPAFEVIKNEGPIILWAGAIDNSDDAIKNSNFLLDAYGNFYANSGYFEGAILTKSTIEAARIKTAIIEGTGNEIGLKFINVSNAMSFMEIIEETNKDTGEKEEKQIEYLTLNTEGLELSSIPAIFSQNDLKTTIQGNKIETGLIIVDDYLTINNNEIKYYKPEQAGTNQTKLKFENEQLSFFVNKEENATVGSVIFSSDLGTFTGSLKSNNKFYLGEKMEYRNVSDGYDLYIKN